MHCALISTRTLSRYRQCSTNLSSSSKPTDQSLIGHDAPTGNDGDELDDLVQENEVDVNFIEANLPGLGVSADDEKEDVVLDADREEKTNEDKAPASKQTTVRCSLSDLLLANTP